ncbi:capsid and scaffold protein [Phage NC-G]|nr:capsid and scaffold protein [Phage NC-G]
MGGYVNIKTFDHEVEGGTVEGTEVSVAFEVYSNAHRISGAHYQTFPSEEPAYDTVVDTADDWATANEAMFTPEPAPVPPGPEA